jgi:DNA-binding beta-propeller fold protein YncE
MMISLRGIVLVGAGLLAVGGSTVLMRHRSSTPDTAQCAHEGPTPLAAPITALERAAVPLATQGQAFSSVAGSNRVIVLDLATGERTNIDAGISRPHEVAVSPDGRWGVAAEFGRHTGDYDFDGHRLAVYDLRAKRLVRVIDLAPYLGPHDLIFVSPTRLFVTMQTTEHVIAVDVSTGQVLGATETRANGSHTLAVTPDGRIGVTANQPEGSFSRMDLVNRRFVSKHVIGEGPTEGIGITSDGKEVWMGMNAARAVKVVDAVTGGVRATLSGFEAPERLALSSDDRYAVITDFRCEVVQVADVPSRRLSGPIAGLEGAGVAKILPDNRTAIILMLDERVLAMADLETRKVVTRFELGGGRPDAAAWGPKP